MEQRTIQWCLNFHLPIYQRHQSNAITSKETPELFGVIHTRQPLLVSSTTSKDYRINWINSIIFIHVQTTMKLICRTKCWADTFHIEAVPKYLVLIIWFWNCLIRMAMSTLCFLVRPFMSLANRRILITTQ